MWTRNGYIHFAIYCSLLEGCEILASSLTNSSLGRKKLEKMQEVPNNFVVGESRSHLEGRKIVYDSFPQRKDTDLR